MDSLSQSLLSSTVDINPHQIDAALFAFRSPLSKGVVLADEVGLGKTIEAGLVLCQYWSTGKRKIIVVCPASLRKQWEAELQEKFGIPSEILDTKNFNSYIREGKNPLSIDSAAPTESYRDFIMGEVRYNSLGLKFPERAEKLFEEGEEVALDRYKTLKHRQDSFEK